jgi:hypothetical protein
MDPRRNASRVKKVVGVGLDVRVVSYQEPDRGLERLVQEFA